MLSVLCAVSALLSLAVVHSALAVAAKAGETGSGKPAFREAFQWRRCLVPVDNFYEWKKTETGKQPYAIALADRHLMALAGLWETWRSPAGERVRSFAIIPTTPNKLGKHAVETILCSFKEILTSDSAYCEM